MGFAACAVFLDATAKSSTTTQLKYWIGILKQVGSHGRTDSVLITVVQILVLMLVDPFLQAKLFMGLYVC